MLSRTLRSAPTLLTRRRPTHLPPSLPLNHQARTKSSLQLNTGAHIPSIGFGTWQDKDAQEPAVLAALAAGYRHIDTARIYGTEAAVGRALRRSAATVGRADVFLTTKLWNNAHHPDDVAPALEASRGDLGVEFVDLYLMVSFDFWAA
jgi:alcohol dehydrogenase (NADP+)